MDRRDEMAGNLASLRELMAPVGVDYLVLSDQGNAAWLAGGGRSYVSWAREQGAAWFVVTPTEAILFTTNIEAGRMQTEEFPDLPYRVVSYPWWESPAASLATLISAGAPVGVDIPVPGLPGASQVGTALSRLRSRLTPAARDRARALGRAVGETLAAVCQELQPGQTELQVAGALAGRLVGQGIDPVVCLIAGDERIFRWRHFIPVAHPIQSYAAVAVSARQDGLVLSCTRLVHFGPPSEDVMRRLGAVRHIDAELISSTRPDVTGSELFAVAKAAYAATGFTEEWRNHHQGGLAGYKSREWLATPTATEKVEVGQLYAWNPSLPGAKSEDTILVGPQGNEILTEAGGFPYEEVVTDRGTVRRPTILIR